MTKTTFDVVFIICFTAILILLNELGVLKPYFHVLLIPIVIFSYYMGQYSQRKHGRKTDN